tara:strand:+ start:49659 stop:50012 length:354 start_codon:yes stop_codon:yes gene_type:complete
LSLPIAAALAFVPNQSAQDPKPVDPNKPEELTSVISLSKLQVKDMQGLVTNFPARNVVEIRMFDGMTDHIRLELLYENGDYTLMDVQAMHLLRNDGSTRDVKLIRTKANRMRFPRLP